VTEPVLVFGISGATWTRLDPLLDAGELPVLASLCARGVRGVLLSKPVPGDRFPRPQTAWATIATGCGPVRHGITRFYHEGADLRERPIWELYSERGLRVGLYGFPGTWPPPAVDGFVVPSHLARDARTWPPELGWLKSIEQRYQAGERGARAGARLGRTVREAGAFLRTARAPLRSSLQVASLAARAARAPAEERALLLRYARLDATASLFAGLWRRHRPDLAAYVTFLVDFASHRYWRYTEDPEASPRLRRAVREAYVRTDRALGRLLAAVPPETTVFVLSEHGMEAEPESAELGTTRYLLDGRAIAALAGLPPDTLVCPVARWIAYRSSGGAVGEDAATRLEGLVVAETGLPLLSVHRNGDAEVIVRLSLSSDVPRYREGALERLTVECGDRQVGFLDVARPGGSVRSAMHAEDAVLVAAGPRIRQGGEMGPAALEDVLPTMLTAGGLDCPAGIDGRVLDAIFVD
jgi:hypothetical protein